MTLTAENLMNTIHQIINDLKQDIYSRYNYNLDENLTYLDLTRNLILLENVFSDESIKRKQEQQQRLINHHNHHSTSSIVNRSYHTANYNPFNIQNQEELLINKSYSHQPPHYQQQNYELDSSKDSIPQFHKQLLKEYKNSMEQLRKQNKIIRTIVQDNSHQQSHYKSRESKEKDYYNKDYNMNTFETNFVNQSSTDEHKTRYNSKSHQSHYNTQDDNYKQRRAYKLGSSSKKQFEKAEKELGELQLIREKELHKIKQIERAIRKREDIAAAPHNMSSQEIEQHENLKTQKRVKDKQYILTINGQISKLDKEIRQITSYIQDCILKEQ